MSSPFEIFRRHQIMTVILIGLAMLSFVIFGAINDPRNIPAPLWVLAFASIVGGAAWVAGLKQKSQNEWGVAGVLAGLVIGAAFVFNNQPPTDVQIDGGGLTNQQLVDRQRELGTANAFLRSVFEQSAGPNQQMPRNFGLGFGDPRNEGQARQFAIDWELLNREADRLGIEVSNDAVNDFMTDMTDGRLRREHIAEARKRVRMPEPEIYRILRDGLAARTALQTLYPRQELPPEQYFDFYRRLNETRNLKLVSLPVEDFVASVGEPSESELLAFFEEFQSDFPNRSPEGEFVAGRPGFFQPARMSLAYAEFPFEDVKKLVDQPTEEEIQAEYDRRYKRSLEDPFLNVPPLPDAEKATDDTAEKSDAPTAAEGDAATDAKMEKAAEAEPVEETVSEQPVDTSEKSEPSTDSPAETEQPADETSAVWSRDKLIPVAFIQEEETGESDNSESAETSVAAKETETPAEKADPKPDASPESADKAAAKEAATKEMAEDKEAGAKPESADPPAAPPAPDASEEKKDAPDEPPTLAEVRDEIVEDLVESRAYVRQRELVEKAQSKLTTLRSNLALSEDDETGLSVNEITEQMKTWVGENGGVYAVTPLLSPFELNDSEDHPIGKAISGRSDVVANVAARIPAGNTLVPREAFDPETRSAFTWWKVGDQAAHVPVSLDEPGVREQVLEAWKLQKAYPKAVERADEIATLVRGLESDADVQTALGEKTITGSSDDDYLTVKSTGPFTWMSTGTASQANPFAGSQASVTDLRPVLGLDMPLGGDFLQTAFRELKPGDVGVAPNVDKSVVFVVAVDPKAEGTEAGPSEEFLQAPIFNNPYFSPYPRMAQDEQSKYLPNVLVDLERKYGVDTGS